MHSMQPIPNIPDVGCLFLGIPASDCSIFSTVLEACEIKKERLVLHFLSRYKFSKFIETRCKDQLSLLSRKVIYNNKMYSILQKERFLES